MKSQKQKRTFKHNLRNFFNINIEKDLQEEESTKKFERVKLFILTRDKLFLSILLFMFIINIFVGFNLNFLYIRQILGFLFIILVPGLLIMLCFKIRSVGFWEYLVYTIGLSVAFIMFAGLAVNWTLPALGITDKPLSLWPILICFDIFLIILGFVAWKRNKDLEHQFTTPKLDILNNIFFIIPMFFPILAILGAFLLNNHGPNILTMIMLGGIAVYVLLLVIFRKRLNENIWPWAILMISVSLLLMSCLRSGYVSGVDTNLEFSIFQMTNENAFWNLHNFRDAYNACLSITLLPTILLQFIKINNEYIFKLFLPILFSFTPLVIYLFLQRYTKKTFVFLVSFFFVSQPIFMNWASIPIKQEIAFLFFGLMLLVLFSKEISPILKKILFLIFGFSMVVSHYSTSYVALAIFLSTYILTLIYKKWENRKIKNGKIKLEQKGQFYLTGIIILLLLIFGFLWYIIITPIGNGLIDFTHTTFKNMGDIFTEDVRSEGLINSQWNIFHKPKEKALLLEDYTNEVMLEYKNNSYINPYPPEKYESYTPQVVYPKILILSVSHSVAYGIFIFGEIIKKLIKVFIIIGIFYLLSFQLKKRKLDVEYIILTLIGLFLLLIIMILPFASIDYDLSRTYQQILFILSLPTIFGGLIVSNFLKEKYKIIPLLIIFLFYFLFCSGFIPQIIGGVNSPMQLNNFGMVYSEVYVHKMEIESANWLSVNYNNDYSIYADKKAVYKFESSKKINIKSIILDILPFAIGKDSYVYSSYTNSIEKDVFTNSYENIIYNFPTEFFNNNKNKIYNNGGSEIFK
jgi:uncharacterized membrane protein